MEEKPKILHDVTHIVLVHLYLI